MSISGYIEITEMETAFLDMGLLKTREVFEFHSMGIMKIMAFVRRLRPSSRNMTLTGMAI